MSAEHRRPLVAFVAVSILCAVMLGHGIRTDAMVGLLGPRVSSSAAQNEPTVTVRDSAPAVAPTSTATGLPGLSAERLVTAAPTPTSAPTPTVTAVVQPAPPATVVPIPIPVATPTATPTAAPTAAPTPPPTAVNPEVADRGGQPAVVAVRKAAREAVKQARQALKEAGEATEASDRAAEKSAKEAEKALNAAAREAAKAAKHELVSSTLPTAVPAP